MAKAKTEDTLEVRFVGLPGPPARLVAGEVVIEAGNVGELPAALARELAADPQMGVELTNGEPSAPASEPEPQVEMTSDGQVVHQHVNPVADDAAEKE